MRLQGLPAVVDARTKLLILGSFPGVRSLAEQKYYAHPQNQFWRILSALWSTDLLPLPYADRLVCMLAHGVGLWDVYASCEREGSLDAAIRQAQTNDFVGLAQTCPQLRAVAHNGGESYRHARHTQALGVPVFRLPSTSPAHASWSFDRKLMAWREVFVSVGLLEF